MDKLANFYDVQKDVLECEMSDFLKSFMWIWRRIIKSKRVKKTEI